MAFMTFPEGNIPSAHDNARRAMIKIAGEIPDVEATPSLVGDFISMEPADTVLIGSVPYQRDDPMPVDAGSVEINGKANVEILASWACASLVIVGATTITGLDLFSSLYQLYIYDSVGMASVPAFPASVKEIYMDGWDAAVGLTTTTFPSDLESIVIGTAVTSSPNQPPPEGLYYMDVQGMANEDAITWISAGAAVDRYYTNMTLVLGPTTLTHSEEDFFETYLIGYAWSITCQLSNPRQPTINSADKSEAGVILNAASNAPAIHPVVLWYSWEYSTYQEDNIFPDALNTGTNVTFIAKAISSVNALESTLHEVIIDTTYP